MKPEFYLDENLRFIPKDPSALKSYIEGLKIKLDSEALPLNKVNLMGEIGYYLNCLCKHSEAKKILEKTLKIIDKEHLGLKKRIQNEIRLGHVLQFQKDFKQSNLLFSSIINICSKNNYLEYFLSYAYQHNGKNLFDQKRYQDALDCFQEALKLRLKQNAPKDQVESTRSAIHRTKELI